MSFDSYPAYRLVQVRFPGSKIYTYLYPADWPLRQGDQVSHPGMHGPDWGATVVHLRYELDFSQMPKYTDLFVLTDWRRVPPPPKPPVLKVQVPKGWLLEVEEVEG